jgi:hypothetical protein
VSFVVKEQAYIPNMGAANSLGTSAIIYQSTLRRIVTSEFVLN